MSRHFITTIAATLTLLFMASPLFAQSQTMQVAGVNRTYILHAPTALPANPPLVFVIHGFNMTGQQEVTLTRMNTVADREKFVVVYPNALPNGSNQQSWDMSGANDYAFLLAIIDSMYSRFKIDRNRVYASGFSQGGFMSFQLGCRYADIFAAIAPVSGLLQGTCNPKRPVPMIFTYGTNEGFDVNTFVQSGEKWVHLAGCTGTPTVLKPYPATNANSVVTRSNHTQCREGAEVSILVVEGGTHEWPMNTQTKVNNSEEVWAFFKRFTLSPTTSLVRPSHDHLPSRTQTGPQENAAPAYDLKGKQVGKTLSKNHGKHFSNAKAPSTPVRLASPQ
jgi:poly(hydroxyalkanoate) depolymerase family esterase